MTGLLEVTISGTLLSRQLLSRGGGGGGGDGMQNTPSPPKPANQRRVGGVRGVSGGAGGPPPPTRPDSYQVGKGGSVGVISGLEETIKVPFTLCTDVAQLSTSKAQTDMKRCRASWQPSATLISKDLEKSWGLPLLLKSLAFKSACLNMAQSEVSEVWLWTTPPSQHRRGTGCPNQRHPGPSVAPRANGLGLSLKPGSTAVGDTTPAAPGDLTLCLHPTNLISLSSLRKRRVEVGQSVDAENEDGGKRGQRERGIE
ncbi:unnamed protein product [Pleuronectes platessa]|uniref:Uncharacterized protein n=1 Tax=Pleuronectes platessa TaxID=8262 RepID=A0A9N7YD19_PLEPL|nr:unnamed protein product [Pleuronectes platessa]